MKNRLLTSLVVATSVLLLFLSRPTAVEAECSKPDHSVLPEWDCTGKLCCPSRLTQEEPTDPCFPSDTYACWARVIHVPPYYEDCASPSSVFTCGWFLLDIYLLVGYCDGDAGPCDYDEQLTGVQVAWRVLDCWTEGETDGTDFYNEIYDDWNWWEQGPPVITP